MDQELLNIVNEHGHAVGQATREEVHRKGYWHETFHCWFIGREADVQYIYFQIRSDTKKDYPSLLDITAAGHILAHEVIEDGIREVKEEIGINVSIDELISVGVIKDSIIEKGMIDHELAHVFLYDCDCNLPMNAFQLQAEEVSGMVKIEFESFCELWSGKRTEVMMTGFENDSEGRPIPVKKAVNKACFVPHEHTYYEHVLNAIRSEIK